MFYEEPVPPENVDALADVRRQAGIPIATGERLYSKWDYRELFAKQAADIVQPDLAWVGGITEAKKIAALAEASYVPLAPHNCQGPVAMAATVQLAAAIPNFLILEYFVRQVDWRDQLVTKPLPVECGYLTVPEEPGLGVGQLNEAVAQEHPYQPTRLSLWQAGWQRHLQG
jgi:galactonate dehydratase